MVRQTSINGRGTSPMTRLRQGVGGLLHDLISLGELQAQLLSVDLRDGKSQAMGPALALIVGVVVALASLPVLILGGAWWLASAAGWGPGVTIFATAAILIAIAGLVVWLGLRGLRKAGTTFARSKREFNENLQWIKSTLKGDHHHASMER